MDLLALSRTLLRHKLVVLPILLLVLLGLFYEVKVKPPTFDANGEIALNSPQKMPTQAQILADPKLYQKVDSNNSWLQSGDLAFLGDAVMDALTSKSAQTQLAAEGVSPKYQIAMSSDAGNPPFLDITGVGTSAPAAINAANRIMALAETDVAQLQSGVQSQYMIYSEPVVSPTSASDEVTSKLRGLIEVIAVGVILLFIAISIAEAFSRRREEELGLDIPAPSKPSRPAFAFRDEPNGNGHSYEPVENTQEFSSPFLSSGARRPIHSLSERRSALPKSGGRKDADLDLDLDEEDD
jgi:capsular polysaccharide biosynthesis protein